MKIRGKKGMSLPRTANQKRAAVRNLIKARAARKGAAHKVYSQEYRLGRFVGASRNSARQWAAAAATYVDKRTGNKIALKMGTRAARKIGLSGKAALKYRAAYVKNIRSMAKDASMEIKYRKR